MTPDALVMIGSALIRLLAAAAGSVYVLRLVLRLHHTAGVRGQRRSANPSIYAGLWGLVVAGAIQTALMLRSLGMLWLDHGRIVGEETRALLTWALLADGPDVAGALTGLAVGIFGWGAVVLLGRGLDAVLFVDSDGSMPGSAVIQRRQIMGTLLCIVLLLVAAACGARLS